MTQIETTDSRRNRKSFSHIKKPLLKIDMTPMVDLGFLLITFFVFTTSLTVPAAMNLFMPDDHITTHPNNLPESLALTFLLDGHDRVYYYHGKWENAMQSNEIFETTYSTGSGMGEVIRQKQKLLGRDDKKGLMLIIKPTGNAAYRNIIDALDEVVINDVKKYVVVEPVAEELAFMKNQGDNSRR